MKSSSRSSKIRPPHVEAARQAGDVYSLKILGRAGGQRTAAIRAEQKMFRELAAAEQLQAEKKFLAEAEIHEQNMLAGCEPEDLA